MTGFCIDVFEIALSSVSTRNWTVHYDCFKFNGTSRTYNDMIQFGIDKGYDAIVGDMTIAAQRVGIADFSQPYIESGIMMLTQAIGQGYPSAWTFFVPFTARMWCTSVGAFFFTGFMLWVLERHNHSEFKEGGLKHRMQTICWFVGSSLILMQRERIKSPIAQLLMVSWVIFALLLGSSYTAGLSSYLTAEKLSPRIKDMSSLLSRNDLIGYRRGSIVQKYLIKRLQIQENRLKPLRTNFDFTQSLSNGSVIAIFDEVPYVNILLSSLSSSKCIYEVVGSKLTTEGFGFAFRHQSPLVSNVSIGILKLSEDGCLQALQKNVSLASFECDLPSDSVQITLKSCISLYIILGGTLLTCLAVHYVKRRP